MRWIWEKNRIRSSLRGNRVAILTGAWLTLFGVTGSLAQPTGNARESADAAFFQVEIRPLLEQRCLGCHDGSKKAGGLDLSGRAAALRGGNAGAALVPGHPERSLLFDRVSRGQMPPTGALPAAEVTLLRRWIAAGAPYTGEPLTASTATAPRRDLWSLQPPVWPRVPRVSSPGLIRNPIDAFVLARLQAKRLKPSPPASRLELIRRLTFDLTGLPPTPEEVAAFVSDRSPDAYEKAVDRLLASPHYGERWGRHWLDVVRYGESHGFEQNHLRPNAWPYRDYVIRSFNQDKPYPQFILEQLAGDIVGKGRPEVEVGTGYLVAGVHDTVGNATPEGERQKRMDDLDDMVATTGAAFLGLTVGCARCHDHKFDPIPTRDYYRLQAVFAGVLHAERRVISSAESAKRQRRIKELQASLRETDHSLAEIDARVRALLHAAGGSGAAKRPPVNHRRNEDRFPPVSARYVRFTVEATENEMQPCLDELEVYDDSGDVNLALASGGSRATASSLLPGFQIHQVEHLNDGRYGNSFSWISNEPGSGWAMIELPREKQIARVVWSRDREGKLRDRLPTAYRIETSPDGREWRAVSRGSDRVPFTAEEIGEEQRNRVLSPDDRRHRTALVAERQRLQEQIETLEGEGRVYAGTFETPGETRICRRGDPMQLGDPVTPGALSAVETLAPDLLTDPRAPEWMRRLALARWIGSPRNPLTARVMVNRVWQHHFGRGIVGTPSDFGFNGEPPTHPELLDWLALKFMASGWRLKPLHRLIVTSATYRQSNRASPRGLTVDADNHLLWRMRPRRLEAETIRDAILATSGKLDRRLGGPSFRLFQYRVVNVAIYEPRQEYGPETWRRAVYQQSARSIRDDLLGVFDCPESAQAAPRRASTTTALQALSLLNGPFVVQQAEFFAERLRREAGPTPAAQVRRAFQLAFGRSPRAGEAQAAQRLVAAVGLPALCRALFNTNEFLYY